jgi:tellurite resistance protein TerB
MKNMTRRHFPDAQALLKEWHLEDMDFLLEKVMAGCAVIAFGDGYVSKPEKDRMMGLIRRFEPLRSFDREHIEHAFERACGDFEHDHIFAEDEAMASLALLRARPKDAQTLMWVCCEIASADGDFSAAERRAAQRICLTLGLDSAQFDLAEAV